MTERATPETNDHFRNRSSYIKEDYELCERLERQRDELVEKLIAIVDLDDGDKPDLWHYETEFSAARALLSRIRHSEG